MSGEIILKNGARVCIEDSQNGRRMKLKLSSGWERGPRAHSKEDPSLQKRLHRASLPVPNFLEGSPSCKLFTSSVLNQRLGEKKSKFTG